MVCYIYLLFGQENLFCAKKRLKIAFFGGHESELPDFGRTWTPNVWHKVNFWDGPERLWNITLQTERTQARYIFYRRDTQIREKSDFCGKTLRTRKFPTRKMFGAGTHGTLCTQDSENVVSLGDRASVSRTFFTTLWPLWKSEVFGNQLAVFNSSNLVICTRKGKKNRVPLQK